MIYPFQPKSTANLRAGQFWPIRLPDGGFACGMVLDVVKDSKREFLAGLIDWHGPAEPIEAEIGGQPLVAQGIGHVKMILEGYGQITGTLPLEAAPPTPMLWAEHLGGREWGLFRGLELIDRIRPDVAEKYPRRGTWGYNVINLLAAKESKTHNKS
ncbi:MAG: hypothetical protein V4689_07665 [Verrucomicrobiota bacterium]